MDHNIKILRDRPKASKYDGRYITHWEEKLDGRRTTIIKRPNEIKVYGRKTYIDNWPLLSGNLEFKKFCESLPDFTAVDGEIFIPGKTSSHVAIGPELVSKPFEFRAFALPYYGGRDYRFNKVESARSTMEGLGFELPKLYNLDYRTPIKELEDYAEELGLEGFVGKVHHFLGGWFKVKPNDTIDVIVVGFHEGEGDFANTLGSMECGVYEGQGGNRELVAVTKIAKGWDRETRDEIWKNRESYLWKVCEVKFDSITKENKLSFSRFVQWREDKPIAECTMDQIINSKMRSFKE